MKPLVKILGMGVAAIAAATLVAFGVSNTHKPKPKPKPPVLVSVGSFTTNLNDPSTVHYVQLTLSVLVQPNEQKTIGDHKPILANAVLNVLHRTTLANALGPDAIASLQSLLRTALQNSVSGLTIKRVVITHYIVQ